MVSTINVKVPKKTHSKTMQRKIVASKYWSEQARLSKQIASQSVALVERTDIKVIKLNTTNESKSSFSTIINSKGVIIID